MRTAVCLICFKPQDPWLIFLSTFTHYDIIIIIDDNSKDYVSTNKKISYAQVSHEDCITTGFNGINFLFRDPTGWEKSLHYFTHVNKDYDQVWFLEEDVFFNSEKVLLDLDRVYKGDLLTAPYKKSLDGKHDEDGDEWLWHKISVAFEPPYYHGMVCANRMSKALLQAISDYASENKTLFFLEALFPSICHKKGLTHETPSEMDTVLWKMDYDIATFTKDKMYHPVKDLEQHHAIRKRLSASGGAHKTRRRHRRKKHRRRSKTRKARY
jgi:hypothetical protein